MQDILLNGFFVGDEDRGERLIAALQYVLECVSGTKIGSREDLEKVVVKGMFYRGMVRDLDDCSLFEQLQRVVAAFEEYQERLEVLSIQVEVSRKSRPRSNLRGYADAAFAMLEFPGQHAVICSYGEHVLVCYLHNQQQVLEVLDVSANIAWFAAKTRSDFLDKLTNWFEEHTATEETSTHMLPTMHMAAVCDKASMSDDDLLDVTADVRRLREAEMAASIKDRRKHVQSLETKIREFDERGSFSRQPPQEPQFRRSQRFEKLQQHEGAPAQPAGSLASRRSPSPPHTAEHGAASINNWMAALERDTPPNQLQQAVADNERPEKSGLGVSNRDMPKVLQFDDTRSTASTASGDAEGGAADASAAVLLSPPTIEAENALERDAPQWGGVTTRPHPTLDLEPEDDDEKSDSNSSIELHATKGSAACLSQGPLTESSRSEILADYGMRTYEMLKHRFLEADVSLYDSVRTGEMSDHSEERDRDAPEVDATQSPSPDSDGDEMHSNNEDIAESTRQRISPINWEEHRSSANSLQLRTSSLSGDLDEQDGRPVSALSQKQTRRLFADDHFTQPVHHGFGGQISPILTSDKNNDHESGHDAIMTTSGRSPTFRRHDKPQHDEVISTAEHYQHVADESNINAEQPKGSHRLPTASPHSSTEELFAPQPLPIPPPPQPVRPAAIEMRKSNHFHLSIDGAIDPKSPVVDARVHGSEVGNSDDNDQAGSEEGVDWFNFEPYPNQYSTNRPKTAPRHDLQLDIPTIGKRPDTSKSRYPSNVELEFDWQAEHNRQQKQSNLQVESVQLAQPTTVQPQAARPTTPQTQPQPANKYSPISAPERTSVQHSFTPHEEEDVAVLQPNVPAALLATWADQMVNFTNKWEVESKKQIEMKCVLGAKLLAQHFPRYSSEGKTNVGESKAVVEPSKDHKNDDDQNPILSLQSNRPRLGRERQPAATYHDEAKHTPQSPPHHHQQHQHQQQPKALALDISLRDVVGPSASTPEQRHQKFEALLKKREQREAERQRKKAEQQVHDLDAVIEHDEHERSDAVPSSTPQYQRPSSRKSHAEARREQGDTGAPPRSARGTRSIALPSNIKSVKNALVQVCLAGVLHEDTRRDAFAKLDELSANIQHFVIALSNQKTLSFKGIYAVDSEGGDPRRIFGRGPARLEASAISAFYKYSSANRQFISIPVHGITATTDAVSVDPSKMGNGCAFGALEVAPIDAHARFSDLFVIDRRIAMGSFSVVYVGTARDTLQEVAIKKVPLGDLTAAHVRDFDRQIAILKQLEHPHILRLIRCFKEPTAMYIVTELVNGGELLTRLAERQTFNEKEARDMIRVLLDALKHLHDKDIVHRDMKPEGLRLASATDLTTVKIVDFRFAKTVSDLQAVGDICATTGYTAPEILRKQQYGCKADIWSFGVICYLILGGHPPFAATEPKESMQKAMDGDYNFDNQRWSHVSEGAKDFVSRMLTLEQTERWSANQLLQHSWINATDEQLQCTDISSTLLELKKFNARRALRGSIHAVMAANRRAKKLAAESDSPKATASVEGAS